ncbi:MAG TPA: kelch repeat-containing protein [Bryobacteraceae bacterium]|nr:kelch repeat-containing protein [Bryobacteraceae bacterium]
MKLFAVFLFSSAVLFAQNTCLDFPSAQSIPFASIAYVTAANSAGDHLVVGSLEGGAAAINAINANIPLPAFVNQTLCGQVQLAPGQYYANVYVPTAAERAGNFPALTGLLVDPATNQPFPNGVIPAKQLGAVYAWRIGPVQTASAIQGWSPTSSMAVTRSLHSSVLLPSGKVLLVGGDAAGAVELYNPATGLFENAGHTLLPHGITAGVVVLNDGRVLIEGGTDAPNSAELFDPVAGTFTPTGSPAQMHGYMQSATLLSDGRVLVVGGMADTSSGANSGAEIYDPKTSKFTSAGRMVVNRRAHTATLLDDGRVLIAGGETGPLNNSNVPPLNTAEIFDPASGLFSQTGSMQVQRNRFFARKLSNGKVLVGGGFFPGGAVELFDPTTGVFTPTGSMRVTRANPAVAVLSSGQILVAGGNTPLVADSSAELYNPTSGLFSQTGSMEIGRNGSRATELLDGRVLVTGGDTQICCDFQLSSAELYTPVGQGLVTSQSGLTFRVAQGTSTLAPQTVAVLSSTDSIPWTVSTHTYTGGNWLTVTPSSGTSAPGGAPATISISANPAGLAAQDYYGSVTLTPTDGKHPPVSISVVLNIVPAGTSAAPAVSPSGLVFLTAPGAIVKPQSFTVTNLTSNVIGFNATASATPNWFTFAPKASGIGPGQSVTITVTPTLTGLNASVFRGSITLTFTDKTTQTVDLLLVTTGSPSGPSGAASPKASPACNPSTLLPVFTSIGSGFTTPVAWPTPIIVQVVDDCGNSMNAGNISVSFSNGDAPLSLLSIGSGTWTGTWVPVRSTSSTFSVRADAQLALLTGSVQVTGQVATNPNVPLVASGGVLSSGDYTSSPALGLLVSIFGSALADGQAGANSLPLPNQLGSTSVIVSGKQLPVLFVNDQQVNVLVPYDLAVNAPLQLIVQRGSAISVPVPIAVFDSQPAILATAGNGTGQGHIYKIDSSGNQILADANAPATAGDYLVIYTVGLGAVNPPVNAGDPAGSNPPSSTTAPVTLTIGGIQAPVFFSGLTPGSAGLYQVNAVVPAGITPGTQVPVAVSVGGKSSAGNIYMSIQ